MKKLLYSLGTVIAIMPISAVIACGANKPKETPKTKTTPATTSEPEKSSISDDIKSKIEQIVIESDKTINKLNKISANTEKSWTEVKSALGLPKETKLDNSLNQDGLKIDFAKPEYDTEPPSGADEKIILTIKKEGTTSVRAELHVKSGTNSIIELSKVRENIYYWKDSPINLKNKNIGEGVTFDELGLSKSAFIQNDALINEDAIFTFKVKTPLDKDSNKIILDVGVKYKNKPVAKKSITITYNFLTFEAVKNATNGVIESILAIDKTSNKAAAKTEIENLSWNDDKSKELFMDYFDNKATSFKDVYYMTKFMKASTDENNILLASVGIVDQKDGKTLTDGDKFIIVQNKIFNSIFDITKTAEGIIDKFAGDDPDLNKNLVQFAAKVNKDNSELKKGLGWTSASSAMGGDETVSYILDKIGYKLV